MCSVCIGSRENDHICVQFVSGLSDKKGIESKDIGFSSNKFQELK